MREIIFDTETTTDETQSLIFGSYRVLREQSDVGARGGEVDAAAVRLEIAGQAGEQR